MLLEFNFKEKSDMELINSIFAWFVDIAMNFGEGIMRLSVGGVAFAIFGARGVLSFKDDKDGPRWLASLLIRLKRFFFLSDKGVDAVKWVVLVLMSVFCGISLFSFGGGILRDLIVLHRAPWFVEQVNQLFAISVIILAYIPIHIFLKRTDKWIRLRNFAYIALVIFDTMGLIEFAQGGQSKALEIMQGQASSHILLFYIFLCGILTQIGGGLCAIVFRGDFSKIFNNRYYYALALIINTAFFLCMLTGNYSASSLSVIFLLSITAAVFVDDNTRKMMDKFRFIPNTSLASVIEEIQFICRHVKTIDVYKTTIYFFNKVKQVKHLSSSAHSYPNNIFHWKQGCLVS
jgi:uncharacterized membrane protein YeiH